MKFEVQVTKSGRLALIVDNTDFGARAINATTQMILTTQRTGLLNVPSTQSVVGYGGNVGLSAEVAKEIAEIKVQLAESSKPKKTLREIKKDELSTLPTKEVRGMAVKWARKYMGLNQCHPAEPWRAARATLEKETGFSAEETQRKGAKAKVAPNNTVRGRRKEVIGIIPTILLGINSHTLNVIKTSISSLTRKRRKPVSLCGSFTDLGSGIP